MRTVIRPALVALVLTLILSLTALPAVISYQGRLTDGGGSAVADGSYAVTFSIYNSSTMGNLLWTSGARQVDVSGGLFSYLLGDSVSLPDAIFSENPELWLGIQVGVDPEISPRTLLSSSGNSVVSSKVNGDIVTSPGSLIVESEPSGDSTVAIVSEARSVEFRGHVTVLKIANGGTDTTNLIDLDGNPESPAVNIGDGNDLDSSVVVTAGVKKVEHRGHVTVLKIANGGTDTTNVIDLDGSPESPAVNIGDGNDPDSSIVITSGVRKVEHRGHVTVLKIANGGADTSNIIDLDGSPESPAVNIGDGNDIDSSVVVTAGVRKVEHRGHVTVLKIANGGADTSNIIDLDGSPESPAINIGDGNDPDSSIVITSATSKADFRGHVTVLKIANGGVDTTTVLSLDGNPDSASVMIADDGGAIWMQTDGLYNKKPSDVGPIKWMAPESIRMRDNSGGNGTIGLNLFPGQANFSLSTSPSSGSVSITDDGATTQKSLLFTNFSGDSTVFLSDFGLSRVLSDFSVGTSQSLATLTVDGDICATGLIGACSDLRYKQNVRPLEGALAKLMKVNGVEYEWNREKFSDLSFNNRRQIGVVAQDIKEILPEVVSESADGMLAVDYSKLTPVLIEAVKEQQTEISDLKSEIDQLKDLVKQLMNQ